MISPRKLRRITRSFEQTDTALSGGPAAHPIAVGRTGTPNARVSVLLARDAAGHVEATLHAWLDYLDARGQAYELILSDDGNLAAYR